MKNPIIQSLVALVVVYLVFVGGNLLGVDWSARHADCLAFLQMLARRLLAFTGSVAAFEIARYYRKKERLLERHEPRAAVLDEAEQQRALKRAIADALAPLRAELERVRNQSDPEPQARMEPEKPVNGLEAASQETPEAPER